MTKMSDGASYSSHLYIYNLTTGESVIMDFGKFLDREIPRKFRPYRDFTEWTLSSRVPTIGHPDDDPMIPSLKESNETIFEDTDEALYALAAREEHISKTDKAHASRNVNYPG